MIKLHQALIHLNHFPLLSWVK